MRLHEGLFFSNTLYSIVLCRALTQMWLRSYSVGNFIAIIAVEDAP